MKRTPFLIPARVSPFSTMTDSGRKSGDCAQLDTTSIRKAVRNGLCILVISVAILYLPTWLNMAAYFRGVVVTGSVGIYKKQQKNPISLGVQYIFWGNRLYREGRYPGREVSWNYHSLLDLRPQNRIFRKEVLHNLPASIVSGNDISSSFTDKYLLAPRDFSSKRSSKISEGNVYSRSFTNLQSRGANSTLHRHIWPQVLSLNLCRLGNDFCILTPTFHFGQFITHDRPLANGGHQECQSKCGDTATKNIFRVSVPLLPAWIIGWILLMIGCGIAFIGLMFFTFGRFAIAMGFFMLALVIDHFAIKLIL